MEARSHPVIFPTQFFNTLSAPNEAKYRYITLYLNAVFVLPALAPRLRRASIPGGTLHGCTVLRVLNWRKLMQ
eukprot:COSAG02_NODE_604_length_19688_cov_77.556231_19_plen_73_part_00